MQTLSLDWRMSARRAQSGNFSVFAIAKTLDNAVCEMYGNLDRNSPKRFNLEDILSSGSVHVTRFFRGGSINASAGVMIQCDIRYTPI